MDVKKDESTKQWNPLDELSRVFDYINEEVTVCLFPNNQTGEQIVCFGKCSKCGQILFCDHADPDHY